MSTSPEASHSKEDSPFVDGALHLLEEVVTGSAEIGHEGMSKLTDGPIEDGSALVQIGEGVKPVKVGKGGGGAKPAASASHGHH